MNARVIELFPMDDDADDAATIVLGEARAARVRAGYARDVTRPRAAVLAALVAGLVMVAGTSRVGPLLFTARAAWRAWFRRSRGLLVELSAHDARRVVELAAPSSSSAPATSSSSSTRPTIPRVTVESESTAPSAPVVRSRTLSSSSSSSSSAPATSSTSSSSRPRLLSPRARSCAAPAPVVRTLARVTIESESASCAPVAAPSAERGPATLYLASLAAGSRPTMAGAARDIARFLGSDHPETFEWHRVRYFETHAIRSWLAGRYAHTTANRYLSCLRGILRQCFRLGLMNEGDYRRATDVEPVRGESGPAGRSLDVGELEALFGACDRATLLGARDAAMLSLLYGSGLRRAEAVGLDVDDVDGATVRVRGKGNKVRTAYLSDGALRAVRAWLAVRGTHPGPLLLPTVGGKVSVKRLRTHRLNRDSVRNALRALAKRAGVAHFSPHDMRRTFVGDLLDEGADLATVQKLAGHVDAKTTARYDRRPERVRAEWAQRIRVPFGRADATPEACAPAAVARECDPPRRVT